MSAKVLPLDVDGHLAIQAMLPWYAAGTLDHADLTDIEAHLSDCVQCRDELAWERRMFAAHASVDSGSGVAGGRSVQFGNDIGHRERLARAGNTQQQLRAVAILHPVCELLNGLRLIAGRLVVGGNFKIHSKT